MPAPDPEPPSFSLTRRWGAGLNVALAVVLLFLVLVMLNYLATRHVWRWRWADEGREVISPQTVQLLESIAAQSNTVKVIVYFDREAPMYAPVKALLTEFELRCRRLAVEYVNYTMQVARATSLKAQYQLNDDARDLVIFDAVGRSKIVRERELYDLDLSTFLQTREARRSTFKGELAFASALLSVTEERAFKTCLLQGHGEHDPTNAEDQFGYAKFAQVLREKNIEVATLSLLGTNEVPADCQLLVIAGPRKAISQTELDKIARHLERGGRMMILLNFQSRDGEIGLERLLATWGVEVGHNTVGDEAQAQSGQVEAIASAQFGNHPVVNPLHGTRLSLVLPRSVGQRSGPQNADAARVTELVFSSPDAAAFVPERDGAPKVERRGPIPMAVAVEKGGIQGVAGDRGSTRLVVVGESIFLGNLAIDYDANRDFAHLAVSWLLDRSQLLGGIGPRPVREYRLSMTRGELLAAKWILMAVLPGGMLGLGLLIWLRRRA